MLKVFASAVLHPTIVLQFLEIVENLENLKRGGHLLHLRVILQGSQAWFGVIGAKQGMEEEGA
jgi:hypothetical protein